MSENIVLVLSGTLTGLLAGLFYAFNVAVVPALRRLRAARHIEVMQIINIKIKNGLFLLSFLGPSLLLPLAAFLHRDTSQFPLLLAAAGLHIIGVNGITIVGNIPLNDKLAQVDVDHLSASEAEEIREAFQGVGSSWMRLHTLRTLAAIGATILVFIVCLSKRLSD